MMVLSGQLAGRFRTAARRCVVGRPRGPTPPIVIERTLDAVTLFCDLGEVAIGLRTAEGVGAPEKVVVPGSLLEQVPTSANTELKLGVTAEGRGQVQWMVKGQAKEEHWDAVSVPAGSGPWPTPRMKPIEASFLAAMHECGRAAARESVRYALSRVQLQGRAGALAGTDGRQLLLWNGFRLPFTESILIPAVPVFGNRELAGETEVRIGRSEHQIVVTAGPWTIWLTIDESGRFPDVGRVIPQNRMTELHLDSSDADGLASAMSAGMSRDDAAGSVSLSLNGCARAQLRGEDPTSGVELMLRRSPCTGPELTFDVSMTHLARALALGFRRIEVASESGPLVFIDERRNYVVTTIVPEAVQPLSTTGRKSPVSASPSDPTHGAVTMPSEPNDRSADDTLAESLGFMAEAEALRDALGDVGRRMARLVASLRHLQKQRRVLQTAWSSLKSLRLGP